MSKIISEGFGPVIRVDVICNKCGEKCRTSFGKHHGCDKCNSWVHDVTYKQIRMMASHTA